MQKNIYMSVIFFNFNLGNDNLVDELLDYYFGNNKHNRTLYPKVAS